MKRKDIVSSTLFDPVEKANWVVNKLVLGIRINDTYGEEVRYELNLKNASLSLSLHVPTFTLRDLILHSHLYISPLVELCYVHG